MSIEQFLHSVPSFVLVFFRLAGMMLTTPFFGSARIPSRIKVMLALVLAAGMLPGVAAPAVLPATTWQLAVGIAGEMVFGLAIGTALTFTFVAATWAGDIIGQQMGLGMGQVFDPSSGSSGSAVSDLYFFLTLILFLIVQGHHAFLRGVFASFEALPLLSMGMSVDLLDLVLGLLQSATILALQLAAPVVVTMFAADLMLGFLGKTVPQINVMTAGLSFKALAGIAVVMFGVTLTSRVIVRSMYDAMERIGRAFVEPLVG